MSARPGISQKRLSQNKFHQLADSVDGSNMASPNDATIEIPLSSVPNRSPSGARSKNTQAGPSGYGDSFSSMVNEKVEQDHDHGPGRRRRAITDDSLDESHEGTLNRMGKFYNAILEFSVITRYMIYVSPLALLIAIPIIIGATVAPGANIGGVPITWFFTWIEVIWLSLWVSKILAHFTPYIFQFLVGIVSSGTRKYAVVLQALEMPLSLVVWCLVSLVTFFPIMTLNPHQKAAKDTSPKPWEQAVKNILFAFLLCSLIFLAEKTLVRLISVSYHRKQYTFRIKESKRNIHLLGYLYEASRSMFPEYCKEFREEDAIISDSILIGRGTKKGHHHHHHHHHHHQSGSATPLRLIKNVGQNVGRFGDKLTAAFGNVAHEITGRHVFNPGSAHSVVIEALERKKSSEALARRIWMSFVVEGKDALYHDDIVEVLGSDREAEAEECFHILDRDGNGDVSLEEMILTVSEFGRVRKSIARSMHDVDQAINVLDNLLLTVAFIVMILLFVSFVTTGAATIIAAGATTLLSLSFVFSTTAQEVLGSCVFLFVKHPFDVGDRVEINQNGLFVEEISLLFTIFRTVTDQRITQVPNVILNSNWIDNITRSKAMKERITLTVDFGTTFDDIQLLKTEMENFVRDKDNSRDFQPDVEIEVFNVGNMDKLELKLDVHHKSNWSNETVRAVRRSKIMCALVLAVRKIPIYGPGGGDTALGDPSNPTYSVAISDEQAKEHREKAQEEKELKRMIPISKATEPTTVVQSQESMSTGVDSPVSSGTALYRGPSVSSKNGTFLIDGSSTPQPFDRPSLENPNRLYKVPSANSELTVSHGNDDDRTALLRAASTGRRKEGSGASPAGPMAPSSATDATPNTLSPTLSQPVRHEDHSSYAPSPRSHSLRYNPNNPFTPSSPPQQSRPPQSPSSLVSASTQPPSQQVPRRPMPGGS